MKYKLKQNQMLLDFQNEWLEFLLNFLCGKDGAGLPEEVKIKEIRGKGYIVLREQLRSPRGDKPREI